MCVAFDPEVIYKNAFYAIEANKPFVKLLKRDIVVFCSILEEEITKKSSENSKYKYVYFNFDQNTLSSFYEDYFGKFNVIGDDIFSSEAINEQEIDRINRNYDDYVKSALKKARDVFKNKIVLV